jgi:hypothetical protein
MTTIVRIRIGPSCSSRSLLGQQGKKINKIGDEGAEKLPVKRRKMCTGV